MHPLRAVLALRLAAACAPRYINVGMPKCGSTSIQSFYQCHGMTSAHWQISRGHYVGDETHACDARGRPLLDCGPCRDVYAQIDAENPPDHCWFPQVTHLAGLVQDYGNATFLLPTRNATAWAHSTAHWQAMNERFTRCQLPSVGAPRDGSAAEGAAFYERVTRRARAMLARAEETHGLRWVEFDITDPAAGELLAATVPGGGRAACWGRRNANGKPAKKPAAKPAAKHHSA